MEKQELNRKIVATLLTTIGLGAALGAAVWLLVTSAVFSPLIQWLMVGCCVLLAAATVGFLRNKVLEIRTLRTCVRNREVPSGSVQSGYSDEEGFEDEEESNFFAPAGSDDVLFGTDFANSGFSGLEPAAHPLPELETSFEAVREQVQERKRAQDPAAQGAAAAMAAAVAAAPVVNAPAPKPASQAAPSPVKNTQQPASSAHQRQVAAGTAVIYAPEAAKQPPAAAAMATQRPQVQPVLRPSHPPVQPSSRPQPAPAGQPQMQPPVGAAMQPSRPAAPGAQVPRPAAAATQRPAAPAQPQATRPQPQRPAVPHQPAAARPQPRPVQAVAPVAEQPAPTKLNVAPIAWPDAGLPPRGRPAYEQKSAAPVTPVAPARPAVSVAETQAQAQQKAAEEAARARQEQAMREKAEQERRARELSAKAAADSADAAARRAAEIADRALARLREAAGLTQAEAPSPTAVPPAAEKPAAHTPSIEPYKPPQDDHMWHHATPTPAQPASWLTPTVPQDKN